MNNEEKSKLDEQWNAAGLSEIPADKKEEHPTEAQPVETSQKEAAAAPQQAAKEESPHTEKKKDIKFLVIYTVIFVVVISGLIAGSYLITSRIHRQMAENDKNLNTSQSTLTNIQNENAKLREENAALTEKNAALTTSQKEAEELLECVGDMVEQDSLLTAAQSAYIDNNRTLAKELLRAVDRDKLSEPNKEHYDLLKEKLGL